jgi:hypothetical protein
MDESENVIEKPIFTSVPQEVGLRYFMKHCHFIVI